MLARTLGARLAPRLHWLGKARGYVSVLDFVHDRYQIPTDLAAARSVLHWLLVATILVPCFVYLLNQYVAFSSTLNAISDEISTKYEAIYTESRNSRDVLKKA